MDHLVCPTAHYSHSPLLGRFEQSKRIPSAAQTTHTNKGDSIVRKHNWYLTGLVAAGAVLPHKSDASITVTLTNQTFSGFNFSYAVDYNQGYITGTLTSVSVNATLNASVKYTYANDLAVYVDIEPLSVAGFLQVGGFSDLSATQRYAWANGGSSAVGSTVVDTRTLTTPLTFTGDKAVDGTIWIGNGYGAAGTSGTWTGTVTLNGVNFIPNTPPPPPPPPSVPEPASVLAFALGPLAFVLHRLRRRRTAS
jgi:hypothetical protein